MSCRAILALPDELIERVAFYRRLEVKTDPLCCEVLAAGIAFFAYQEDKAWQAMIDRFHAMPGFMADWYAVLSDSPLEKVQIVAYDRSRGSLLE